MQCNTWHKPLRLCDVVAARSQSTPHVFFDLTTNKVWIIEGCCMAAIIITGHMLWRMIDTADCFHGIQKGLKGDWMHFSIQKYFKSKWGCMQCRSSEGSIYMLYRGPNLDEYILCAYTACWWESNRSTTPPVKYIQLASCFCQGIRILFQGVVWCVLLSYFHCTIFLPLLANGQSKHQLILYVNRSR